MTVTITGLGPEPITVNFGDPPFAFGREDGPGFLTDDKSVSKTHGLVHADEAGWSVSSVGRYYSFTIYDRATPSRLVIPLGVGPVPIPFGRALLAVEIDKNRHVFEIDGPSVADWDEGWSSILRRQSSAKVAQGATVLAVGHNNVHWRNSTGDALRWYQVLAALCEPRLRPPFSEQLPSNKQIAARLGCSVKALEDRHMPRLRDELGLPKFAGDLRNAAVVIAINQGLVTTHDLEVLGR